MYTAILDDEKIGPGYGWYRTVVTQSRFGWEPTRTRYDRDQSGSIECSEFPGSDIEFARLDRDRDRKLTRQDFDFITNYPYQPARAILSPPADQQAANEAVRKSLMPSGRAGEQVGSGQATKTQIEEVFSPASRGQQINQRPTKTQLIELLFRQQMGSLQPGPKLDEPAPDFTLKTGDGKSEFTLSRQIGPRPIVLVFGNFTCGQFRHQGENIETLHHRYGDRANFVMVYVREAHPIDGWKFDQSDPADLTIAQPKTYDDRAGVAQVCSRSLGFGFPVLVDTIDDSVGHRYSASARPILPDRPPGQDRLQERPRLPSASSPTSWSTALILLLQEQPRSPGAAAGSSDHKKP